MAEQDFELYLSLLSRFLRLKAAQRQEIADELRDHLEERLGELTARGLSREAAIREALEEFGDAAELANHFTQVSRTRKRRMIMRLTFGTAALLAASLLIATAFWPQARDAAAPGQAVAQGFGNPPFRGGGPAVAVEEDSKQAIEAKLSKRIGKLEFESVPLAEVIEKLGDQIEIDILFDRAAISEEGLAIDSPVDLQVRRANVSARGALELVLEPFQLNYTIRDGVIMITTTAKANQIQVYNVQDLLQQGGAAGPAGAMMSGGSGGGGFFQVQAEGGDAAAGAPGMPGAMPPGMGGMGGFGGRGGGGMRAFGGRVTNSLADLIATTIDPASWDLAGGNGSIMQYDDLLVVKNSQAVHGKIKALLEMMRSARRLGAAAAPGAGGPAARGAPIGPSSSN